LADILLIWLAFETAFRTRQALPLERNFDIAEPVRGVLLLASITVWVLSGYWLAVYDGILRGRRRTVALRAIQQSLTAGAGVVLFEYFQRIDLSRPVLGLFLAFAILALILFRLAVRLAAPRFLGGDAARRYVYIVGTGPTALRIGALIENSEAYGLQLLGFLDAGPGTVRLGRDYAITALGGLAGILGRQVVDEIVFAVDSQRLAELEDVFLLCEEEGVRTRLHVDFFPHIHSRVGLEQLEREPMLTFSGAPHDEFRLLMKRLTDLAGAGMALMVLAPVLLAIWAVIRLSSRGPGLFQQERCGLNGRRFTLYKFRTMVEDAEARKAALAHLNVKQTAFKIPDDPRLTGVGRWLRKFSLDELPQLWNVVRGEMAIVGPRPPVPEEVAHYERWQRRRLRMRPGLTCLWALAGRDGLDFDEWMRLDLDYIDRWSLSLDWWIMLKTVPAVLLGRGAN